MKLEEAIETTRTIPRAGVALLSTAEIAAINLLIEAGKLVESLRKRVPRHVVRLLPGETEQ